MDKDASAKPDILSDLTDLGKIGSGVADAVWAGHCIEHLYQHEIALAFAEIHRILKADGVAIISVPDVQTVAQYVSTDRMHETIYESESGPVTAHDVIYGFGPELARGHFHMAHRSGFTPTLMLERLKAAGFPDYAVIRRPSLELVGVAVKQAWRSEAERAALFEQFAL